MATTSRTEGGICRLTFNTLPMRGTPIIPTRLNPAEQPGLRHHSMEELTRAEDRELFELLDRIQSIDALQLAASGSSRAPRKVLFVTPWALARSTAHAVSERFVAPYWVRGGDP